MTSGWCSSSQYGKSSSGPKQDPRPVSDKAYQANCIRLLISYLTAHGYDQPLSPKLLTSPMSKDVTSIMHFLLRQVQSCQLQHVGWPVTNGSSSCSWCTQAALTSSDMR